MIQFADFFFSKYDIQMKRNATTRSAAILNSVFLFWKCSLPIVSQVPTKVSGLCHFGLVIHGFCDRALTLPSCLVFGWALVYVLCFMLERGVRIPAFLSCSGPVLVSCRGFVHSCSRFGLAVGAWGLEFARAVRSSVRVHSLSSFCFLLLCLALCGTQLVFFTGCVLSCLSCFMWTRSLWVSLLAAC